MARIVLTADYSLMTNFRDLPLATFFSCIPTDFWYSRFAFRALAPKPPHNNGKAVWAPYGLRKLEASLLSDFHRDEIVVAHPEHVNRFIGPETEVVGLHTMDPLGLGPVSMSFTNGGVMTPYTKACFEDVAMNLPNGKRKFKVVVGGAGVWHFDYRPEEKERYGIDHLVRGEVDHIAGDIFRDIMDGSAPESYPEPLNPPKLEEIPPIVGPSMHGMIEVMRGCGRGCQFCEVTLRKLRYFSPEYIQQEASVNARAGLTNAWLQSDDIFLYKVENYRTMMPNADAIKEIFQAAMDVKGIESGNPTHGTLASVAADPDLIEDLSQILNGHADRQKWVGIQSGLETGSVSLVEKIMPRKLLPYQPSEWPEVVRESIKVLNENKWFPALTAIIGLPGETADDAYDTCVLLDQMEKVMDHPHFIVAPLSFVPIGVLRGEEFYRMDEMIDEARFNVVFRCWRHILREIDETLWDISSMPFLVKAAINTIGRIGGRHVLSIMERFADRRGYKIWPALA